MNEIRVRVRDNKAISKTLSYWLRHDPAAAGLALDGSGWASTDAILAGFARQGSPVDLAELQRVVASSDKNRFEFAPDFSALRARQGHSVPVDLNWPAAQPPDFLYHGTVERFLPAILDQGLQPRSRHHVHLSPDPETARQVGGRRGKPVILRIRARAMGEAGFVFLLSSNGVWLTDRVPPAYLERL